MSASLIKLFSARARVLLVGPPGCGKTARVYAAASALGMQVSVLRASIIERVDVTGALVPDHAAGVTRELPLAQIAALRADAPTPPPPTVLFLDDLGQAPMDVQAACMRLFDPGYLHDNVLIVGATNRPSDKAGVVALCEPLRSRFDVAFTISTPENDDAKKGKAAAHVDATIALASWSEECASWCEWALGAGVDATIVAWHRATTGRTLYQWRPAADPAARMADFRSWHSVARLVASGISDVKTLSASIGPSAAVEFCAYSALTARIPSLAEIEASPDTARLPEDASQSWLVATCMGAAMSPQNCAAFLAYMERLPRVYCALAARDAYRRRGADLARSPAWSAWFIKNQELFAQ